MKVIFIFAHPDDETFFSGGTIALLTKKGITVKLICATKGEAGQLGNPPLCTQEELGSVREKEHAKALKILGILDIYYLGFIDGTLKKIGAETISKKIQIIVDNEKPDIVVTFDSEGTSHHPDHIAMSKAATKTCKIYANTQQKPVRLYYTTIPQSVIKKQEETGKSYDAFGKITGTPDNLITTKIDISREIETKIQAMKAHKTQHQDTEKFLQIPEFAYEFFRLVYENKMV